MARDSLRILLLEDVAMDAEIIEYELRKASIAFETRRVDTGEAFDASLHEFRPDVILSDYTLPRFDGMAALERARAWGPTVPFIIVTGSINEETAVRCMKAGATDYLLKNNLARIGPAIEAALERESARGERRLAQAALRRSEANLRAIFDNTLQAFILADRSGRIQALNAVAARYALQLTGDPLLEGDEIPDFAHVGGGFRRALAGERVTEQRSIMGRDGVERFYEATCTPVVDDHRGVIGVCLSAVDITERRHVEENLRRAERMQATGRLAGGVAHEVNNMMTAVMGFADFLLRSLSDGDQRRADVLEILKAARRAADVTRQLLAFSRQQFLRPRVLELNELVAGLEPMLRRSLGECHELTIRLAPDIGCVRADPSQIEQVLLNLALNARDAMPSGGRILVETDLAMLDSAYAARHPAMYFPTGPYLLLAVSDSGHGMDAATLARIFEPFFTTKAVGQGTGLGLSTAYGIVKQSNGFIWAYSEPGEGTTFKVYLPRVGAAADAVDDTVAAPARGGEESILIVEDEEVVRDLACRSLRGYGYTVLEARNGAEALALVGRNGRTLDLVLTDLAMPEMGGRELAARLAELVPELPVLYMSGYTGEDIVARGLLAPGAPLQPKPFTPEILAAKVRQMLDARVSPVGQESV
jgi:two-component system cell cycle sensor histidine kinase/response regulator CckA